jgi:hypothetical protein
MESEHRINSILESKSLETGISGFPTFDLSQLQLDSAQDFDLPQNRRLGHLVEVIVAECIKSSANYRMIDENIQIIEEKNTVGELDFILEEKANHRLIHLELAYKFYLYDPSLSESQVENWIGPNRNDFLIKKLEKLRQKQFPLLHHPSVLTRLSLDSADEIDQRLCLMASLYLPFREKVTIPPIYHRYVKGHYYTMDEFQTEDAEEKLYHLPIKTEWGIDPRQLEEWSSFDEIKDELLSSLASKRSRLCWEKYGERYREFFVVWW